MNRINIAIDGPAGAGKSTVARLAAAALGFIYVDTGAMYRAVTLKALRSGLRPEQSVEVARLAGTMSIELVPEHSGQRVIVNGEDVTEAIRTPEVTENVSLVSQIGDVRRLLVSRQQQMATGKGVVMDGRDIGTHVLPDAELKIYMTATVGERARRRAEDLRAQGYEVSLDQLTRDIELRDKMDRERAVSPLVQASDAVLLDSTDLTVDQTVERIVELGGKFAGRRG